MEEEELARRTGLAFGSWHVNWYLVLAGVSWNSNRAWTSQRARE
jgi:hypothetical protein